VSTIFPTNLKELLAMRSLYLDYSKNLPFDYIGQVKSLNIRVLDFAVPQIISEADMLCITYGTSTLLYLSWNPQWPLA
jgi:hypothetical protein